MHTAALRGALERGLTSLGLALTATQTEQLLEYLALFAKWNRAYNLSAIRDVEQMLSKHLLDSLSVAHLISGQRLIDIGTGGGLPGIPLAIAYPDKHLALLDSVGKKTRFLFQVQQSLGLSNIEVVHSRVEQYQPSQLYQGVISRAFSSLCNMTSSCQHLLANDGKFFAMKGLFPEDELSALQKTYRVDAVHPLQVPDLSEQRCLVVISRER